jgi:hypothetical protein
MTIYEVIENFFIWVFPEAIYLQYVEILELLIFTLSLAVVFGIIIMPLWKLATVFIPNKKKVKK